MYEVVVRTIGGRCLLRPVDAIRDGVNAILARAIDLYAVLLHAYTYLSNHGHLLLTDTVGERVSPFMGYVNRQTARLAKRITGARGSVWCQFTPIPVLDDDAALGRLRYILANGVKERLVARAEDWPGPSSTRALLGDGVVEGTAATRRQHHRWAPEDGRQPYRLELAPLPAWADWPLERRRAKIAEIVDEIASDAEHARGGKPPLGIENVLRVDPFATVELDQHAPPPAHFADTASFAEYDRARRAFFDAYRQASARRRATTDEDFPAGGFPCAGPFVRSR